MNEKIEISTTKEFNQILKKYQNERIQAFINACKEKFFLKGYLAQSIFLDVTCGHSLDDDPHTTYISGDFDKMLKSKENSDVFFAYFTHPYDVLYEHAVYHWVEQTQGRLNAWNRLCTKIDKYCQMHYGCNWGEQDAKYEEPIPNYLPLAWDKTKEDNMVNRPLYYKDTLIGFVKKVISVSVVVGYDDMWDDDELEYASFPKYKKYNCSIAFYGTPKIIEGINFYQKDNFTYILNENLANYEVLQDRINIINIP